MPWAVTCRTGTHGWLWEESWGAGASGGLPCPPPPPSSVIKVQNLEQPGVVLRGKERLQAIAGLIKKAKYAGQGVDTLILLLSLEKEP